MDKTALGQTHISFPRIIRPFPLNIIVPLLFILVLPCERNESKRPHLIIPAQIGVSSILIFPLELIIAKCSYKNMGHFIASLNGKLLKLKYSVLKKTTRGYV